MIQALRLATISLMAFEIPFFVGPITRITWACIGVDLADRSCSVDIRMLCGCIVQSLERLFILATRRLANPCGEAIVTVESCIGTTLTRSISTGALDFAAVTLITSSLVLLDCR